MGKRIEEPRHCPQEQPSKFQRENNYDHLARSTHSELSLYSRFSENVQMLVVVWGGVALGIQPLTLLVASLAEFLPPFQGVIGVLSFLRAPPQSSSDSSGTRFLLLIFLVALLCGAVLFCLPCWLRRCGIGSSRRTLAVFAVGDLDPVYGRLSAHFWPWSLKPYEFEVN